MKTFSKLAKKRHELGDTTIGWQTRNILTPSYPEKLTMDILNEKLVEFEYEKKLVDTLLILPLTNI